LIHPDTELRHINGEIGFGVFATRLIPRGTIVWTLCELDRVYSPADVAAMTAVYRDLIHKFSYVNIAGEYVLAWDLARYINHSCEPTMRSVRSDIDIAVRDISPGQELTCEYAFWIRNEFRCACRTPSCRGWIRREDVFRLYHQWDNEVAQVLSCAPAKDQPLEPFLRDPDEFWEFAQAKRRFPSHITYVVCFTDGRNAPPEHGKRSMNYVSPKLQLGLDLDGKQQGVRAETVIETGELLVVFGGEVGTREELEAFPKNRKRYGLQIEENLFLLPPETLDAADFVNHSCAPNAVLSGPIALVARRQIQAGEPICYDYATSDGCDYDEFDCSCGAAECRGRITGEDWSRPELQRRYENHFSPYLERRINGVTIPDR
jgi:hypothetical protein